MTGEIENGDLAIRDVADLLQSQYAIIAGKRRRISLVLLRSNLQLSVAAFNYEFSVLRTGGKTREGCPIITFPDNGNFHNLCDLDYQRLMLYLTSVPT